MRTRVSAPATESSLYLFLTRNIGSRPWFPACEFQHLLRQRRSASQMTSPIRACVHGRTVLPVPVPTL